MTATRPELVHPGEVINDAHGVADRLVGGLYGLVDAEVRFATRDIVCFWLTLEPWAPMAADGYPTERVAVTIWRDGQIAAVPVRTTQDRRWCHRHPRLDPHRAGHHRWILYGDAPLDRRYVLCGVDPVLSDPVCFGKLCLWYPHDPRELRWEWSDGLHAYITVVHRHLQAEELWRRTDQWPAEDAPHGEGDHPVRTWSMRLAAQQAA